MTCQLEIKLANRALNSQWSRFRHCTSTPTTHRASQISLTLQPSSRQLRQPLCRARRYSDEIDDQVTFDDEGSWENTGTRIDPSAGPIVQQAFNAVGIISGKITQLVLQFTPNDIPPSTVRTAVNGALILLALSFVKGLLSFVLLVGTILFAAYVSVRIFGLDSDSLPLGTSEGKRSRKTNKRGGGGKKPILGRESEFSGLLGDVGRGSDDGDGLLDVWFDRSGKKNRK